MHWVITRKPAESRRALRRLLGPRSSVKLVDDDQETVSPSSWRATLRGLKRPLIRLLFVKRGMNQSSSDEPRIQQVDSSDTGEDSDGYAPSRTSRSTYSSPPRHDYTSSSENSDTADGSHPVSAVEQRLHKLYKKIKTAEREGDEELIYSLKYKMLPELELSLIRLIDEDYDRVFIQGGVTKSRTGTTASDVTVWNIPGSEHGDQDEDESQNRSHEDSTARLRRIHREERIINKARSVQKARRNFQADEGHGYHRIPNLKGISQLVMDESRWYEAEARHKAFLDDMLYEGHQPLRNRGRKITSRMGERPEDVYYLPQRQSVISALKGLKLDTMYISPSTSNDPLPNSEAGLAAMDIGDSQDKKGAVKLLMALSHRRRSINRLSQELLQNQDDLLSPKPIFLWRTGLELKPSVQSNARKPPVESSAENMKPGDLGRDASKSAGVEGSHIPNNTPVSDAFKLGVVLQQIHENLATIDRPYSHNIAAKLLYKHGSERQIVEVEALLKDHPGEPDLGVSDGARTTAAIFQSYQMTLLKTAKAILSAFIPITYHSVIVGKFWGAIYGLLQDQVRCQFANCR